MAVVGSARRRWAWAAAFVAVVTAVVSTPGTAGAAVAGDLSIAKASFPTSVTAGNRVLYRVTVTNLGTTRSFRGVEVTDTIPSGTVYEDALSTSWCDPAGATVRCAVPGQIGPGQSVGLDVVVSTTATTASFANAAEITASKPLDPFRDNNRATARTVVDTDTHRSAGFLAAGGTASASSRNGRPGVYTLTAPASSNGVVFDVEAQAPSDLCGATCLYEDAVKVDFAPEASLPDRQVDDRDHPLVLTVRMGLRAPCRGIGGDAACFDLWWAKGATRAPVAFCTGAGPGSSRGPGVIGPDDTSPCKNHQFKTPTGEINFEVLLLSTDPTFYG